VGRKNAKSKVEAQAAIETVYQCDPFETTLYTPEQLSLWKQTVPAPVLYLLQGLQDTIRVIEHSDDFSQFSYPTFSLGLNDEASILSSDEEAESSFPIEKSDTFNRLLQFAKALPQLLHLFCIKEASIFKNVLTQFLPYSQKKEVSEMRKLTESLFEIYYRNKSVTKLNFEINSQSEYLLLNEIYALFDIIARGHGSQSMVDYIDVNQGGDTYPNFLEYNRAGWFFLDADRLIGEALQKYEQSTDVNSYLDQLGEKRDEQYQHNLQRYHNEFENLSSVAETVSEGLSDYRQIIEHEKTKSLRRYNELVENKSVESLCGLEKRKYSLKLDDIFYKIHELHDLLDDRLVADFIQSVGSLPSSYKKYSNVVNEFVPFLLRQSLVQEIGIQWAECRKKVNGFIAEFVELLVMIGHLEQKRRVYEPLSDYYHQWKNLQSQSASADGLRDMHLVKRALTELPFDSFKAVMNNDTVIADYLEKETYKARLSQVDDTWSRYFAHTKDRLLTEINKTIETWQEEIWDNEFIQSQASLDLVNAQARDLAKRSDAVHSILTAEKLSQISWLADPQASNHFVNASVTDLLPDSILSKLPSNILWQDFESMMRVQWQDYYGQHLPQDLVTHPYMQVNNAFDINQALRFLTLNKTALNKLHSAMTALMAKQTPSAHLLVVEAVNDFVLSNYFSDQQIRNLKQAVYHSPVDLHFLNQFKEGVSSQITELTFDLQWLEHLVAMRDAVFQAYRKEKAQHYDASVMAFNEVEKRLQSETGLRVTSTTFSDRLTRFTKHREKLESNQKLATCLSYQYRLQSWFASCQERLESPVVEEIKQMETTYRKLVFRSVEEAETIYTALSDLNERVDAIAQTTDAVKKYDLMCDLGSFLNAIKAIFDSLIQNDSFREKMHRFVSSVQEKLADGYERLVCDSLTDSHAMTHFAKFVATSALSVDIRFVKKLLDLVSQQPDSEHKQQCAVEIFKTCLPQFRHVDDMLGFASLLKEAQQKNSPYHFLFTHRKTTWSPIVGMVKDHLQQLLKGVDQIKRSDYVKVYQILDVHRSSRPKRLQIEHTVFACRGRGPALRASPAYRRGLLPENKCDAHGDVLTHFRRARAG